VDDWSVLKGRTFGTLLVDLERHQPVDLLPDREGPTLTAWLLAHPGVEVVSRDRSTTYAEAIRLGAPHALQVADRWHLMKN
jgi:transposase